MNGIAIEQNRVQPESKYYIALKATRFVVQLTLAVAIYLNNPELVPVASL